MEFIIIVLLITGIIFIINKRAIEKRNMLYCEMCYAIDIPPNLSINDENIQVKSLKQWRDYDKAKHFKVGTQKKVESAIKVLREKEEIADKIQQFLVTQSEEYKTRSGYEWARRKLSEIAYNAYTYNIAVSYTSPAGRNSYSKSINISMTELQQLLDYSCNDNVKKSKRFKPTIAADGATPNRQPSITLREKTSRANEEKVKSRIAVNATLPDYANTSSNKDKIDIVEYEYSEDENAIENVSNQITDKLNNNSASIQLTTEQKRFMALCLLGRNVLVDACIGSGKTTAIQYLCNLIPTDKQVLYLTYNRLLKLDAQKKINNENVRVQNYHGYAAEELTKRGIKNIAIDDLLHEFNRRNLILPKIDILIIDEYQDIDTQSAAMLQYIKSSFPNIQIIMVGDLCQKIYDYSTIDITAFVSKFIGAARKVTFTQCFRLSSDWARQIGEVWNKPIVGTNKDCHVCEMSEDEVIDFLIDQNPADILCLGPYNEKYNYANVLNSLEQRAPEKFNKNTVYASIRERDENLHPDKECAIFTTYDASKGLEKKICVLFDWSYAYWDYRSHTPHQKYDILRNIFCVAASRGKEYIIIVKMPGQLTWNNVKTRFVTNTEQEKSLDISHMFDFAKTEYVDDCFKFIDCKKISRKAEESEIEIKRTDGLIDLSLCIGNYQEAMFFDKYDIDEVIQSTCKQKEINYPKSIQSSSLWNKILYLTSVETGQNRYMTQVDPSVITEAQLRSIEQRLQERCTKSEDVQIPCNIKVDRTFNAVGRADVVKDNVVYELKFTNSLSHAHFLQCACYVLALELPKGILWNIRTNEAYEITLQDRDAFLDALTRMVTDIGIPNTISSFRVTDALKTTEFYKWDSDINLYDPDEHKRELNAKRVADILAAEEKAVDTSAKYFAVLDTETAWNDIRLLHYGQKYFDAVFSIGVIIADAETYKTAKSLYFVLKPESDENGYYKSFLYYPPNSMIKECTREESIEEIKKTFAEYDVNDIFAYNAGFDYRHLDELHDYNWHDIIDRAAYEQYNPTITLNDEVRSSGRLKSGYGVEAIYQRMTGDMSYCESHCALFDAWDELMIMKLLGYKADDYPLIKQQRLKEERISPYIAQYEGKSKAMKCGMDASILKYRNAKDIDVEFSDGTVIEHVELYKWKRGTIKNPNVLGVETRTQVAQEPMQSKRQNTAEKLIGQSKMMNCGMEAEIIKYNHCKDITIRFEDGTIKEHCRIDKWRIGKIGYPQKWDS